MNHKSSGILKKSSAFPESRSVELLVFGYHCKLFRDDEKALIFDKQEHLINAPYAPKDSISRYDVRATLSDIAPYEASSNSYINRLDGLSQAEQQAEQLAEEERYYSLYRNEVEEELYKEEQEKRLANSGYNQVAFNYEESNQEIVGPKESSDVQQENDDSDDTPFTPSEELNLPAEMEYPNSLKLNQIIEKTAKFISSQGPQMEILLKTKQSSNKQFEFLNHNGQYNAYYKHILAMMKSNTYPWQNSKIDENSRDNDDNSNTNDSNIEETTSPSPIIIPKMQFKPSADCAYTQLISKITKAPIAELERKNEEEIKKKQAENNLEPSKAVTSSLGLVASYNSDSDSNQEDDENEEYKGPIPPSEIQIVIDKTAAYVAKNGSEFEQKLIFKQDPRFQFLHESDEFHLYYKMKVKSYQSPSQVTNSTSYTIQPTASTTKSIESPKKVEIILPKAPPAPVSFSIKAKEERQPLKSTNMENSDDETKNNKVIPEAPSPPRITSIEEELERQVDIIATEREEKLAKERLSNKLLSTAREKLGMLPKEKMLQIERKKKAMLFINQIKGSNGSSSNGGSKREDDIINLTQCGEDSNDSVSVKSLAMSERSRSRKNSSSRSSRSTSRSRSTSSRSSDSSPKRKRSKKKSHRKRKYRKSRSRSRSRSPARYKHSKRW